MIPIKIDQPGVIQYLAAAGDGVNTASPATPFQVPFYIYDVTALSVYRTPAGTLANDAANLLVYDIDCFGGSYADPTQHPAPGGGYYYGFIALTSSSFPTGTNADDIITIFYDFGSATIIPKYPLCSTADPVIDSILPVLPANHVWVKSSNGSSIQTAPLPTIPPSNTTTNAAVKFITTFGDTQSSNTILTPIILNNITYDDVVGINNLTINGNLEAEGNIIAENLEITSLIKTSVLSIYSSIYFYDQNAVNKTTIKAPQYFSSNITYILPASQATEENSFLSNDATGKLAWLPQNHITTVGNVTLGTWSAGAIHASGNITASGNIRAGVGGSGTFPSSVNTTALTFGDSSTPYMKTTTISSPEEFNDNYEYILPTNIGSEGNFLSIANIDNTGNTANLSWSSLPQSVKAWVRFYTTTAGSTTTVHISSSYNVKSLDDPIVAGIIRISTGIYNVTFANAFTSGQSYSWQGTGYLSSSNAVNIYQAGQSIAGGQSPQAGSCVIACCNLSNTLVDPANDVCISFFGT